MLTPWVSRILFVNLAIYLAGVFLPKALPEFEVLVNLTCSLRPAYVMQQPWTLVTYMFLHAGFAHIFFNMLSLFFFGPRLELELGGRRFLGLYMTSGIAGGLLSWVFSSDSFVPIVGASGAILGVMWGYARFWPNDQILIMFLPMPVRIAVIGLTALDVLGGFGGGGGNVAHFAHLGGALGGIVYLRLLTARPSAQRSGPRVTRPPPREPRVSRADMTRWSRIRREELHEVNREEFDRIMAKIDQEGIGSVTARERSFLDTFSDRASSS
ncbi:MAG TPA: rhomboid family intramembrane serine protease [Polyangiaceae bacterium]|nr:rhomboid family intramembrane serine protease [Polyangiaceae bacterium]